MIPLPDRVKTSVARVRRFFGSSRPALLVGVHFPPDRGTPVQVPPLCSFDLETQLEEQLDLRLASHRPTFESKADIDDDWLPHVHPFFGISEHSAWLGMDVRLQEATSLPVPIVHGPGDLARLVRNEQAVWFRRMQRAYAHLRRRQDGTFIVSVRGTMCPMDMANAVRGDELYTDFYDQPAFVHALLSRLEELTAWYFGHLLSWCDQFEGGHVFGYTGTWLPAGTIGHLSNDATMLCAPAIYDEFGFPYEARLIARFGRAIYHIHNQHLHYVPKLATLSGLMLIEVTHDPKTVHPLENLEEIVARTGDVPLLLRPSSDLLRRHIGKLVGRRTMLDVHCRDRADALDILALVGRHGRE
jgi:hypothetical protein